MQGDGTSRETAFIPENWEEFLTAIRTNAAYVSVPPNTIYKLSEIYNNQTVPEIIIRAREIQGNNSIIMDGETAVYASGEYGMFRIYNPSIDNVRDKNEIYNLHFIDLKVNSKNASSLFVMDVNQDKGLSFWGCNISATINNLNPSSTYSSGLFYRAFNPKLIHFNNSALININLYGNSGITCGSTLDRTFRHCIVYINDRAEWVSGSQPKPLYFSAKDCYVYGNLMRSRLDLMNTYNTVFNLTSSDGSDPVGGTHYSNGICANGSSVVGCFFVDNGGMKYPSSTTYVGPDTYYLRVITPDQLKDTEFMYNHGFMIPKPTTTQTS